VDFFSRIVQIEHIRRTAEQVFGPECKMGIGVSLRLHPDIVLE